MELKILDHKRLEDSLEMTLKLSCIWARTDDEAIYLSCDDLEDHFASKVTLENQEVKINVQIENERLKQVF